jgi:hypothetical protein
MDWLTLLFSLASIQGKEDWQTDRLTRLDSTRLTQRGEEPTPQNKIYPTRNLVGPTRVSGLTVGTVLLKSTAMIHLACWKGDTLFAFLMCPMRDVLDIRPIPLRASPIFIFWECSS